RPPEPAAPAHFFLRDEFGQAARSSRLVSAASELPWGLTPRVDDEDLAFTDVGDQCTIRRKLGVKRGRGASLDYASRRRAPPVPHVDVPTHRDQDAVSDVGPGVFGDSKRELPLALPTQLFLQ